MKFTKFSDWVYLKEQAPVPGTPAQGAVAPPRKDDALKTDARIKQVMAANLTDEKKRKAALQNLAKQMAMSPNNKAEDLKKVADALKSDEQSSNPLNK
jgi:hypothetical protein